MQYLCLFFIILDESTIKSMLKQLFPAIPSLMQMTPKGEVPAFKVRESQALRPE